MVKHLSIGATFRTQIFLALMIINRGCKTVTFTELDVRALEHNILALIFLGQRLIRAISSVDTSDNAARSYRLSLSNLFHRVAEAGYGRFELFFRAP